jgi:hypothetical protein
MTSLVGGHDCIKDCWKPFDRRLRYQLQVARICHAVEFHHDRMRGMIVRYYRMLSDLAVGVSLLSEVAGSEP